MGQTEKAELYNELKDAGVTFDRHYREYKEEELRNAVLSLRMRQAAEGEEFDQPAPAADEPPADLAGDDFESAMARADADGPTYEEPERPVVEHKLPPEPDLTDVPVRPRAEPQRPVAPVQEANPHEMAAQRQNTNPDALEPIRIDPETGHVWYQEEVRKPAYAKPRGRRVVKYQDTGVQTKSIQQGEYIETFELPGEGPGVASEVKVTLPSYQVGIYKDRRFPFKIHVYNEMRGFDLFEVAEYFGGIELVPAECKRIYVANVLCFDMRTVVRAITSEYRRLQLAGVIKD